MNLTTIQRAELFLSEIYCRAINEFPSLQDTDLKLKVYSTENFILLIDNIRKYKNFSDKQSKLCELLEYGIDMIAGFKNQANPIREAELIEFVDEYLEIDPDYSQQINIELHRRPFDLKNKQYKKYLKLKKEHLFLELINAIYTKQPNSWKSDLNAVEVNYNFYMAEFKKFDIEWLENEINQKENYLPQIKSKFVKREQVWAVASKLEKDKDLLIKPSYELTPDEKKIKSETDKTQKEIILLGQLLDSLKSPLPDQDFIRKHLPYYGEGTERMLRDLLRENKQLINKIISNE